MIAGNMKVDGVKSEAVDVVKSETQEAQASGSPGNAKTQASGSPGNAKTERVQVDSITSEEPKETFSKEVTSGGCSGKSFEPVMNPTFGWENPDFDDDAPRLPRGDLRRASAHLDSLPPKRVYGENQKAKRKEAIKAHKAKKKAASLTTVTTTVMLLMLVVFDPPVSQGLPNASFYELAPESAEAPNDHSKRVGLAWSGQDMLLSACVCAHGSLPLYFFPPVRPARMLFENIAFLEMLQI